MKHEWIKALVGKLAATGTMLLFLVLVPAAAAGSLPLWAVLLLGGSGVLLLNAACGVLLSEEEKAQPEYLLPGEAMQPVSLRVVRGNQAA